MKTEVLKSGGNTLRSAVREILGVSLKTLQSDSEKWPMDIWDEKVAKITEGFGRNCFNNESMCNSIAGRSKVGPEK